MKTVQKLFSFFFKKHRRKTGFLFFIFFVCYLFCLPRPIFKDPSSMVLQDKKGNLLGARIASDGQWRFPYNDNLPENFVEAIIEFEDKRFFSHWGIDPKGIARAIKQNFSNRKIVSGGSTISMQVIRMSRRGKPRTFFQKLLEAIKATRLEFAFSKKEILALYSSNAPFGGNVVGLDAAAWRYYGKKPKLLSWSEAATLAVLPNSPALIHPGRNRDVLLKKRNRLLDRLFAKGLLDKLTCELAKEEKLPNKPLPLPRLAPHLLERVYAEQIKGKKKPSLIRSTIDRNLQKRSSQILGQHQQSLVANGIHNAAVIIIEVETGNIVSYHGNMPNAGKNFEQDVDVIKAPRSTGSILKPFLYAMTLQEGKILPNSLISDIPTRLSGYQPKNYHETYDGVISARKALIRSLNIPMVRLLQKYGLEKFHFGLKQLGLSDINKPPTYYGLPLILGGAEASLWDITNAYAGMSRVINHFQEQDGQYNPNDFRPLNYIYKKEGKKITKKLQKEATVISASAAWSTFDAMLEVERPNSEGDWQQFQSSQRIAWKTGTSFGFRDAWAIGVTPNYVVGVWVGNADGEGRPGLVGILAAAPILFDLFDLLPSSNWFDQPIDEMIQIPICKKSAYRALDICDAKKIWVPNAGIKADACSFHHLIHLDKEKKWQVNSDCESPTNMNHVSWFVLPPVEEHYYKTKHPNYQLLPPFRTDCSKSSTGIENPMQMIYPNKITQIYVPIDLDGTLSKTVFKLAHRIPKTTVYWHIDNEYIGSTKDFHHFELNPKVGKHKLTLVDEKGYRLEEVFEILGKDE